MAPPRTKRHAAKTIPHRMPSSSLSCVHSSETRKEKDHRISKRYISKRRLCANKHAAINEERLHELLADLKLGLTSNDVKKTLDALHEIRGGVADAEHIDTVLQGDIMPLIDACLEHDDREIRFSAVWILTNVACGDTDQTSLVAERLHKVVPLLTTDAVDDNVLAQCLWMLANIAGDCAKYRDEVVRRAPFSLLEMFVSANSSAQVLENVAWLLSNIARQGPAEVNSGEPMCEKILNLLSTTLDSSCCDCKVISEACRAVLHVLHNLGEPDTLEMVKKSGILRGIVRHSMRDCDRSCFAEMVKLVADFLSADDESCQVFIDQGALHVLSIVMHEEISELYYFACFATANLFACSSAQIQCAINYNLLSAVIHHLEHGDFKIQKEAAIAMCSFLGAAQERQVLQAFNKGLVPPLVQALRYFDASIVYDVLASLFNLMEFAKDLRMEEEFLQEMLDSGVQARVLSLLEHGHEQISQLARDFVDKFLAPASTDRGADVVNAEKHRTMKEIKGKVKV